MVNTQKRINSNLDCNRLYLAGTGLCLALIFSGVVWAHSDATGVVKERMDMMEELGDSMKTLKSLVRNQSGYDADQVVELARSIQEMSKHIGDKFPEGSNHRPSEALPSIWENWDRFTGLIEQMDMEAAKLGEVAVKGDQRSTLKQFIALGRTCKGCHTDFRRKKDK